MIYELRPESKKVCYAGLAERKGTQEMKKMAVVCYMIATVCVLYAIGIMMTKAAGTRFYLIWFVLAVMFGGAGLFLQKKIWFLMPAACRIGMVAVLCTTVFFFVLIEGLILKGFHAKAKPELEYLIVLGAQMKKNGPSIALARRLDAAAAYLQENPETLCVVSGGKGSNEPISEAQGMYEYLVKKGIEGNRIILEDQSRNTFENLEFSRKLIPEKIKSAGIVTSNFHVYRALQLSKIHGFEMAEGIGAGSGMYFLPNNMLREFFGVVKDWVFSGMPLF